MPTLNGQKLNFDYTELDEFLSQVIDPQQLDQEFRTLQTSYAQVLVIAFNEKDPKYQVQISDSAQGLRILDEFFRILGQIKKGGES